MPNRCFPSIPCRLAFALTLGLLTLSAGGRADPPPAELLARIGQHVLQLYEEMSFVVSDEHYRQRIYPDYRGEPKTPQQRILQSEVVMLRPAGATYYQLHRDVLRVNRRSVPDRETRLIDLFQNGTPIPQVLSWENSRHNISPFKNNFNTPITALMYLEPVNQHRLQFELAGIEQTDGRAVVVIRFRETVQPTMILFNYSESLPVSGEIWVDPHNGRILHSRMDLEFHSPSRPHVVVELTTTFRSVPGFSLPLPVEMRETHSAAFPQRKGQDTLKRLYTGHATYSNFRRFLVEVDADVAVPLGRGTVKSAQPKDNPPPPSRPDP